MPETCLTPTNNVSVWERTHTERGLYAGADRLAVSVLARTLEAREGGVSYRDGSPYLRCVSYLRLPDIEAVSSLIR